MNYDTDGDFGKVFFISHVPSLLARRLYYCVKSAGWHQCNDRYHITREKGADSGLLLCTVGGQGALRYAGAGHVLLPGSVALLAPDRPHEYYTPEGGEWEFFWLHFTGANFERFSEYLLEKSGGVVSGPVSESCADNIQRILDLKVLQDLEFETISSELISLMLHQLAAAIPEELTDRNEAVAKVLEYIHLNYPRRIDLDMMCHAAYISRSQLVRIFEAATGYTPYEYLTKYRINQAKKLLSCSRLPVGEIAVQVGFSYPGNFISAFRKLEGVTPAKYRKQYWAF